MYPELKDYKMQAYPLEQLDDDFQVQTSALAFRSWVDMMWTRLKSDSKDVMKLNIPKFASTNAELLCHSILWAFSMDSFPLTPENASKSRVFDVTSKFTHTCCWTIWTYATTAWWRYKTMLTRVMKKSQHVCGLVYDPWLLEKWLVQD